GAPVAVGRVLGLGTRALVLVARIAGLVTYIAVAGYAVRRFVAARWLLVVCALAPVALFQAAVVSADGLTNAAVFLLLANVVAVTAAAPGRIDSRLVVEALVAVALLALTKPPYALLAF